MTLLERKVNALSRALLEDKVEDRNRALIQLDQLMQQEKECQKDLEKVVHDALVELGVPDSLRGHSRLVLAISLVVEDNDLIYAITKELYPMVADMQHSTASKVERNIRHAIEVCWDRVDLETMQIYFGNTVSPLRGKPTNGEFISRVARVVRERMKGAQ